MKTSDFSGVQTNKFVKEFKSKFVGTGYSFEHDFPNKLTMIASKLSLIRN